MGQSPSADLYFGHDLGDELGDLEWMDAGEDWEDELARRLGWNKVDWPTDRPQRLPRNHRLTREELDIEEAEYRARVAEYERASPTWLAYAASRDEKKALLDTVPVELDWYGYLSGDSAYAIRVRASVQRAADWGSIPLKPMVEAPEWRTQLDEFVRLLGFDLGDKQPGWHLNCSYG